LKAWADSLGGIKYPLLSDFWPHGAVAEEFGVMRSVDGHTERALFVIDKQGVIRYIDVHDIDSQPNNEDLRVILRQIDPIAAAQEPVRPQSPLPHGGIVMYCTKWCTDCVQARAWLHAHKLAYTEIDIYSVEGALDFMRKHNDGSIVTPTFDIDGTIVIDFDAAKLSEILKDRL
jgi:glutaredoxin